MDKQLKNKAVKIKGKDYVLVSDRILFFNQEYENGCITTELVSDPTSDTIIIQAFVRPDASNDRVFTWYAQEVIGDWFINKTSALENAETSAVGRALAMMWIGVIDSVASVDEINKAKNREKTKQKTNYKKKLRTYATGKIPSWLEKEQAILEVNEYIKWQLDLDVFDIATVSEENAKNYLFKLQTNDK